MTLIIVTMLILAYLLIATGHLTGVNKAAIAMFLGTIGWVVYICWGHDFVMSQHPAEYLEWLSGETADSDNIKLFIYDNVFLKYVGKAAAIVLFLLATMSIIELLNNNGCFDFITEWIRTRNSKRLLWTISLATFLLSANLDNLTTTAMMLVIMHRILQNSRQRMYVGSAILIAASCGGCFTVIGDPTGLILWGEGAVTASRFSAYLALPALLAWVVPTIMINRELPDRLDTAWSPSPYRGDDTRLNRFGLFLPSTILRSWLPSLVPSAYFPFCGWSTKPLTASLSLLVRCLRCAYPCLCSMALCSRFCLSRALCWAWAL